MNTSNRLPVSGRPGHFLIAALLAVLILSGCSIFSTPAGTPSVLAPGGPAAVDIASLWWIMLGLGTAVFILVMALTIYVITSRRKGEPLPDPSELVAGAPEARSWIWYGGVLLPALILPVVLFFTVRSLGQVGPTGQEADLHFTVVGRQWFWEVHGPDESFETANELHIPVGVPVRLTLLTGDVIHSFWVPELHGKMDLVPGRENEFWIQADEPGRYRGLCAEFCGLQHANMQFIVVAEPQEDFNRWMERESGVAVEPETSLAARGQEVFSEADCAACHTIRGTEADGAIGPDLTHVGSRITLGAGILTNSRGNLGGWIANPQHIKPGNNMPALPLSGEDLQALIAYLEALQ